MWVMREGYYFTPDLGSSSCTLFIHFRALCLDQNSKGWKGTGIECGRGRSLKEGERICRMSKNVARGPGALGLYWLACSVIHP